MISLSIRTQVRTAVSGSVPMTFSKLLPETEYALLQGPV